MLNEVELGKSKVKSKYRVTMVVSDLDLVDLNFDVPPSARFC